VSAVAQSGITESPLPKEFVVLEKFNSPMELKFDSIQIYAICTGYISTDKKAPEPVFVWLIKTPEGNYLIDGGLSPNINDPDYFKGFSKPFFEKKFDFYLYKENDLIYQLNKLGIGTNIKSIILTHGHFDHIGYLDKLPQEIFMTREEKKQIEIYGQADGYEKNTDQLINFNRVKVVELDKYKSSAINKYLMVVRSDEHTKGHQMILLLAGAKRILFTGDVNMKKEPKSDLYNFIDQAFDIEKLILLYNHDTDLSFD
jgi:glyoxylase-like metal-dependent hydrolase (beta-lactamase superfamily II)